MNKLVSIIVVLLVFVACKTPEARKPISVKTGSFIDEQKTKCERTGITTKNNVCQR